MITKLCNRLHNKKMKGGIAKYIFLPWNATACTMLDIRL